MFFISSELGHTTAVDDGPEVRPLGFMDGNLSGGVKRSRCRPERTSTAKHAQHRGKGLLNPVHVIIQGNHRRKKRG